MGKVIKLFSLVSTQPLFHQYSSHLPEFQSRQLDVTSSYVKRFGDSFMLRLQLEIING